MTNTINDTKKTPKESIEGIASNKKPMWIAIVTLSSVAIAFIAWFLMLAQSIPTIGSVLANDNPSANVIIAGATLSAVAAMGFLASFILIVKTKINIEKPFIKFIIVALVLSFLALIFNAIMAAGIDSTPTTQFYWDVVEHIQVFASFYTLFFAGAVILATIVAITIIKNNYKIKKLNTK